MHPDFKASFYNIIRLLAFIGILFIIYNNNIIKIDNLINESFTQDNQDFSQYNQNHKFIALYYSDTNNSINNYYKLNKNINNDKMIEEQIKLAKSHGIYGFGIVYNLLNYYTLNSTILNLFSNIIKVNFFFCVILNVELNDEFIKNQLMSNWHLEYNKKTIFTFFDQIKHYFFSDCYIKYKGEPVLGIFHSKNFTSNLIEEIKQYQIENNIKKFFVISIYNDKENLVSNNSSKHKIIFSSQKLGLTNNLNQKFFYNYYYSQLFNQEANINSKIKSFIILNGSPPNKFLNLFKKFLKETCYNNETIILINAWNNYKENLYLMPNKEYGFSYLNCFSKAIFNLEESISFDLTSLINKTKIAVQVHLYYEELIEDIINKTNNIPVKFDLFITIISPNFYRFLDSYIKNFSKCDYYEILIVENKGRDVLPFLTQIKPKYRHYKYICHIHTKKSNTAPKIGFLWRNYLFNNLLGNINITSEILNDFENNKKLGFIFPETFYGIIQVFYILTDGTKYWMDVLSSKLFGFYSLGKLTDFPAGNMFWAKIRAIYQIFECELSEYFPKEGEQTNDTIMHAIERIWLYLVKYNHFKYKNIFKIF